METNEDLKEQRGFRDGERKIWRGAVGGRRIKRTAGIAGGYEDRTIYFHLFRRE